MNQLDILGYTASVIMLISMLMKDMGKFRLINTLACILFVIYGGLKSDNPLIGLNFIVIVINVVYLFKNRKK